MKFVYFFNQYILKFCSLPPSSYFSIFKTQFMFFWYLKKKLFSFKNEKNIDFSLNFRLKKLYFSTVDVLWPFLVKIISCIPKKVFNMHHGVKTFSFFLYLIFVFRNVKEFHPDYKFGPSQASWKNSIRHNLSLHKCFQKQQNENAGCSSWWSFNPDAVFVHQSGTI